MKIAVIGGTGLIGSKVSEKLDAAGHEVVAASPRTGINVITGEGLDDAFDGASVVVDVANAPAFDDQSALDFFQTAGRNILAAEVRAGVRHHVALSVVGTDRLQGSGYFRAKLAQERFVRESPIPYTLIRATQFFEFVRGIAEAGTLGNVVRVNQANIQPIAAEDVATFVAAAALNEPGNNLIEIAGPEVFSMSELIAMVLAFDGAPERSASTPKPIISA
ncbi:SDR family oxidoreductase [Sphingomonas sp. PR090111-T3T-6A]|uniref:SDR family oxidoreductase n=1 Tax=Sphingomonas sp. PR090111-T3T-6A TaxID=685778 RepID=UPI00039A5836|nr:NmrA family NAD(P)-binding protein [Sphingomonas sp. PR090111-T3T-6A]